MCSRYTLSDARSSLPAMIFTTLEGTVSFFLDLPLTQNTFTRAALTLTCDVVWCGVVVRGPSALTGDWTLVRGGAVFIEGAAGTVTTPPPPSEIHHASTLTHIHTRTHTPHASLRDSVASMLAPGVFAHMCTCSDVHMQ